MGRPHANRRSSSASEQSLLRSFSAIRHPPTDPVKNHQYELGDGQPMVARRNNESLLRGKRRGCPSPTGVAPPVSRAPAPARAADKEGHRERHMGFRRDYDLGDALRAPSHAVPVPAAAVDVLGVHDFAFVRRSEGSFSYAIVAYRSEECLTFVVSGAGSTKRLHKRHWGTCVRLAAGDGETGRPPVGIVSFNPRLDDECSAMSSVSDRVRALGAASGVGRKTPDAPHHR